MKKKSQYKFSLYKSNHYIIYNENLSNRRKYHIAPINTNSFFLSEIENIQTSPSKTTIKHKSIYIFIIRNVNKYTPHILINILDFYEMIQISKYMPKQ